METPPTIITSELKNMSSDPPPPTELNDPISIACQRLFQFPPHECRQVMIFQRKKVLLLPTDTIIKLCSNTAQTGDDTPEKEMVNKFIPKTPKFSTAKNHSN